MRDNILSFEKLKKNMNNPSYVEFDQLDATKLNTLDSGQSEHQHRAVTIEPLRFGLLTEKAEDNL